MARLNESRKRNPELRNQPERRASLDKLIDVSAIMSEMGLGERRAMAEAERRLGLVWHNGAFGKDMGHYPKKEG